MDISVLLEASRDPIWVIDADQKVIMVNRSLERMTGLKREHFIGKSCVDLMGVETREGESICKEHCPFQNPSQDTGVVEGCLPTGHGSSAWIQMSYGRVRAENGDLTGVVHIIHDLTERKAVEDVKDEFIAMVSHEMRSPLHHIKGFATTLLQTDVEWDADTERDFLESINREADRLSNLVEKTLHLSRLDQNGLPAHREWYSAADLVDTAFQRRPMLTCRHRVNIELSDNLPMLYVDGREIEIVIINLLENAMKYSQDNTPVNLRVSADSTEILFEVRDHGLGVRAEEQERIFERFYRAENGMRSPGTGLGLAICKRIVEAHSGTIWVSSRLSGGSSFFFQLPLGGDRS
jgi:PAS domain S-box-containing protein